MLLLLLCCCCRNVKSADQKDEHGSRRDLFSSKRWICRQRYFALQFVVVVVELYIQRLTSKGMQTNSHARTHAHTQFIYAWNELSNASLSAVKSIRWSASLWVFLEMLRIVRWFICDELRRNWIYKSMKINPHEDNTTQHLFSVLFYLLSSVTKCLNFSCDWFIAIVAICNFSFASWCSRCVCVCEYNIARKLYHLFCISF